ncbi:MAG: hypothetical protein JWN22_3751 [Nocardioides sp.]|jgi:hypothetical protein|nr:hypothetical protein [Nocardioides sp.]
MSDVWCEGPVLGPLDGFHEDPVEGGPPLPSPDGHWWWDGHAWVRLQHAGALAPTG